MQMKYAASSFYAIIFTCMLVLMMSACAPSSANDPGAKADEGMDAIINPSAQDQMQLTQKIQADLGVVEGQPSGNEIDFANWFFADASFVRESVEVDRDKAIVHYTVKCRDLATLAAFVNPTTSLQDAMRSCAPIAKSVDMYLTKKDEAWTVSDAELNGIARQVFIGE